MQSSAVGAGCSQCIGNPSRCSHAGQCSAERCSAVQCSAVQCYIRQCRFKLVTVLNPVQRTVHCSEVLYSVQWSTVAVKWSRACSGGGISQCIGNPSRCSHAGQGSGHCSAVQCSAVQCSAVQCSAVQCSAVQCSAVQCSAVQCSAVQCSAVQCSAVQCRGPFWQQVSATIVRLK